MAPSRALGVAAALVGAATVGVLTTTTSRFSVDPALFGAWLASGGASLSTAVPAPQGSGDVPAGTCETSAANVSDCCCGAPELERANDAVVHRLLERVVATPFFSHFRMNLCTECELWHDSPLCTLKDCSVCECETPPSWASEMEEDCGSSSAIQQVEQTIERPPALAPGFWDPSPAERDAGEDVVVNLRENPERYTGYSGESAARVWDEIHNRNCFKTVAKESGADSCADSEQPAAQRVYNRLVSGLHSSISLHIAHGYCLERSTTAVAECALWGPNLTLAQDRVLSHPERVENLYAAFAVLLRAVAKAGPAVASAVPRGDDQFASSIAEWEESLFPELIGLAASCPKTFDEQELFSKPGQWSEIQARLEHLAEIMKCVGCDRCKLWGTLQTQGLATALKVLASAEGEEQAVTLSRQEAVALVHTLERLSSSLAFLGDFRREASASTL